MSARLVAGLLATVVVAGLAALAGLALLAGWWLARVLDTAGWLQTAVTLGLAVLGAAGVGLWIHLYRDSMRRLQGKAWKA